MTDSPLAPTLDDLLQQRTWLADLAAALVRDPHDADDAAQETWAHALRSAAPRRDARAWLATVLANVVRMRHRGTTRRRRREHAAAVVDAARGPADAADAANERFELQRTVAAAVHTLDEPFRSTVLLHHFEGLALAAIARAQQVPAGTVRWRLHRAHERLRGALARSVGRDWRAALGALAAPLPRGAAALAPVALGPLLLLGGALVLAATVWAFGAGDAPTAAPRAPAPDAVATVDDDARTPAAVRSGLDAAAPGDDAAAAPPPPRDQRALVRARIVDAEGAPVAGASLRLARAKLGRDEAPADLLARLVPAASAGADGAVALPLRAPAELLAFVDGGGRGLVGEGTFVASAPGHADEQVEAFVADGDDRWLGAITLHAVADVDGRVVDERGRPVLGARVCAQRPPFALHPDALAALQRAPDGEPATTVAPGTGAFTLAGVRRGPALIWASKPGFVSAWRLVDVDGPLLRCDDLVLRPAAEPPAVTARSLRVRVVDEHAAPVANARVGYSASYTNGWSSLRGSLLTANGTCTMPKFQDDGSIEALQLWISSADPRLACVAVLDPPLDRDEIVVVLPPGEPFEVRVRGADGEPASAFTVVFEPAAPAAGALETRGRAGVATLATPCVAGELVVRVEGSAPLRAPFEPGATRSPLELTVAPLRGITGVVTWNGRPVEGARVSLLHLARPLILNGFRTAGAPEGLFDAVTGADGRFRIDHDTAEPLLLQVRAEGFASALSERCDYEPAVGWNDVALALDRGGAIEGVVRDRAGDVRPRAVVAVHDFHGDARTVLADAHGRFRFEALRAGEHELRLAEDLLDANLRMQSSPSAPLPPPQPNCTVRAGETTRMHVVVDRCRLVGALRADGFAPRGWTASLSRAHDTMPVGERVALRGDGSFTLPSDTAGPHVLSLVAPGGPLGNATVRVPVELAAGDTLLDVPLALAPFAARADGAGGVAAGASLMLWQQRGDGEVWTWIHVDPLTLQFTAPLAQVGDVVLTASGEQRRELGRFVVPRR